MKYLGIALVAFFSAYLFLLGSFSLLMGIFLLCLTIFVSKEQVFFIICGFFVFMFFLGILALFGLGEPQILKQADEGLTYFLLFFSLFRLDSIQKANKKYLLFLLPAIIFTIITIVSSVLNHQYAGSSIKFLSYNLEPYVLLLCFIVLDFPVQKYTKLIRFVIMLGLIQMVIGIFQFFLFHIGSHFLIDPKVRLSQDVVTGTLCSHGIFASPLMGYLMLILFTLFLYNWIFGGRLRYGLLAFLSGLVFFATYTESVYIFLPLIIIFILINKFVKVKRKVALVIFSFLFAVIFIHFSSFTVERYSSYFSNGKWKHTGKVRLIEITKNLLSDNFEHFLVGYGPASFSSDSTEVYGSKLYRKFFGLPKSISSAVDTYKGSITTLLIETGSLGFIFYFSIVFYFMILSFQLSRKASSNIISSQYSWWLIFTFQICFMALMFNVFERDIFPHFYFLISYYFLRLKNSRDVNNNLILY